MWQKREKKGSAKKRTTAAVREKRTKARERRRAQIKEMKPSEETPENEEKQQKKSRSLTCCKLSYVYMYYCHFSLGLWLSHHQTVMLT